MAPRKLTIPFAAAFVGACFGFTLAWSGMSDPDAIRRMLLLEDSYLWLTFAVAVAVAFVGVRVLRRLRVRSLSSGNPVAWSPDRIERRHVTGSVLFGVGWSLSSSCPGPIAAQLGQGLLWSVFTIAGIGLGVALCLRRHERAVRAVPPNAAYRSSAISAAARAAPSVSTER